MSSSCLRSFQASGDTLYIDVNIPMSSRWTDGAKKLKSAQLTLNSLNLRRADVCEWHIYEGGVTGGGGGRMLVTGYDAYYHPHYSGLMLSSASWLTNINLTHLM